MKKYFIGKQTTLSIELFRYLIVGGFAFVVDFSTLYVLATFFSLHYLVANVFAFLAGLTTNYLLSTFWVFTKHKQNDKTKEMILFSLIGLVGLGINEVVLKLCVDMLLLSLAFSKILATAVVFIWNFAIRKIVLF